MLLSQAQALAGPGDRLVGAHFRLILALAGSYKELAPVSPVAQRVLPAPGPTLGAPMGLDYSHPSPGPEWSYAGFLELSSKLKTPSGWPWLTLCSGENPQASLQDPTESVGGGALGLSQAQEGRRVSPSLAHSNTHLPVRTNGRKTKVSRPQLPVTNLLFS